jgi:hypothetical protein
MKKKSKFLIKMEFPPEILAIIREYYQPCFKYGILYKRFLELSKFREWTKLKELLQSNPNAILSFLLEYEEAQIEWLKVACRPGWYEDKLSIRNKRNKAFRMLALKINA